MTQRVLPSITRQLRDAARDERGSVIVLVTIAMTALIGMVALSVDVGRYLEVRRQLQNAADAAAHAGVQSLPDTTEAATVADAYFNLNIPASARNTSFTSSFPDGGFSRMRIEATADVDFILAPIFGIFEGEVDAVAEVTTQADEFDVAVVIDRSGSMCKDSHGLRLTCPAPPPAWHPFTEVQSAATNFPDYFLDPSHDTLGIVSYSSEATLEMPLSAPWPDYDDTIADLAPDGYTNIGHGIDVAHTLLNGTNPERRKLIVLLSDGIPNIYWNGSGWTNCGGSGCSAARNYALDEAQDAVDDGIQIFTIGLGDSVDGSHLQEIADIGGGEYVHSPTAEELDAAFQTVARLVRLQFIE